MHAFTKILLKWNQTENHRSLPWKQEKDPYKIWLSEVLLQQTRAEQALPYYQKFINKYPNIIALANANEQEVFALWQGLGYYSRCRNLLFTAQFIRENYKGKFPEKYEEIRALKGVGDYTAAAITSFAYNQPYAVVDGNVYRVLARFFNISTPIDTTLGKKEFAIIAQQLLDKNNAAIYNQAMMDFGATVCTPKKPKCLECPLAKKCATYKIDLVESLPIKCKKLIIKERHFHYFVFTKNNKIYIQQRIKKDVWQNLWEFYLIEGQDAKLPQNEYGNEITPIYKTKQKLTHQLIFSYFYILKNAPKNVKNLNLLPIYYSESDTYAFSKSCLFFLKNAPIFTKPISNN